MKNKVILIASSVLLTTTFSMHSPKVEASKDRQSPCSDWSFSQLQYSRRD